jgi:16S rRNA processing protein RimM
MSSTPIARTVAPATGGEVLVGLVAKVHGLRGELAVDVRTDSPEERFAPGSVLVSRRTGRPDGTLTVESARPHSGRLLVRFVEVPDRTAAEEMRGARLLIGVGSLVPAEDPEEFHAHQLEGLRAELADGEPLGTVREIVHGPGGDLLVVAREGRADLLVPFVREIVPTVDLEGGRVVLTPPEGLLDLDQN